MLFRNNPFGTDNIHTTINVVWFIEQTSKYKLFITIALMLLLKYQDSEIHKILIFSIAITNSI